MTRAGMRVPGGVLAPVTLMLAFGLGCVSLDAQTRGGPYIGLGVEAGFLDTRLPEAADLSAGLTVIGGWDFHPWLGAGIELHFQQKGNAESRTRTVWAGPLLRVHPFGGPAFLHAGVGHLETSVAVGADEDDPFGGRVTQRERGAAAAFGGGVEIAVAEEAALVPFATWVRAGFADLLTLGVRFRGTWPF